MSTMSRMKLVKNPNTASFEVVANFCQDDLRDVKLMCFISVAKELSPFLQLYQTDAPMIPFLSEDVCDAEELDDTLPKASAPGECNYS